MDATPLYIGLPDKSYRSEDNHLVIGKDDLRLMSEESMLDELTYLLTDDVARMTFSGVTNVINIFKRIEPRVVSQLSVAAWSNLRIVLRDHCPAMPRQVALDVVIPPAAPRHRRCTVL